MEAHPPDPKKVSQEEAWREVSDRFTALGAKFKEHYRRAGEEGQLTDDELRQTLRTLGEALDRAFGSVGEALRDPEVRSRARDAATSLVGAFSATFAEVGDELGKAFKRQETAEEKGKPAEERPPT